MHMWDYGEEHSSAVHWQVCIVPSRKNNCNNYIFSASDLKNVGQPVLPKQGGLSFKQRVTFSGDLLPKQLTRGEDVSICGTNRSRNILRVKRTEQKL